jgi:hypothetical protein
MGLLTTDRQRVAAAERVMLAISETDFQQLSIEERNRLLDEYRRAEETIDALAEARKEERGW